MLQWKNKHFFTKNRHEPTLFHFIFFSLRNVVGTFRVNVILTQQQVCSPVTNIARTSAPPRCSSSPTRRVTWWWCISARSARRPSRTTSFWSTSCWMVKFQCGFCFKVQQEVTSWLFCCSVVFLGFDFCKRWVRKSKPKENTAQTGNVCVGWWRTDDDIG